MLHTEYEFTLPLGYVDPDGTLHRTGVMRLCTALDELEAMRDARVRVNESYLSVVLLSRVIERLGGLQPVSADVIERLFSADFAYLQDFFVRLNDAAPPLVETECPKCRTRFSLDLSGVTAASEVT
jgi:hypothetical protein